MIETFFCSFTSVGHNLVTMKWRKVLWDWSRGERLAEHFKADKVLLDGKIRKTLV